MAKLPLQQPNTPNVYSYGFDRGLNRELKGKSSPTVYDTIQQVLNTGSISNDGNLNLKSLIVSDSIIASKRATVGSLLFSKRFVYTSFPSTDGWRFFTVGVGTVSTSLGWIRIQVTSDGAVEEMYTLGNGFTNADSPYVGFATKNPFFETQLSLESTIGQTSYFGLMTTGSTTGPAGGAATWFGIGFKYTNVGGTRNLYAVYKESGGSEQLTEIAGQTQALFQNQRTYRFNLTSRTKAEFYINNVLVVTITGDFLNTISTQTTYFGSKNTSGAGGTDTGMVMSYSAWGQDN